MKKFKAYDLKQITLLPPSLRDWLRPDHPAYFACDVADGFDLSAILDKYSETRGQPPYNPRMMTKVLAVRLHGRHPRHPFLAEA
jgi:transposase